MRWNAVRTIRWALVAFGLVAGGVLLATGATVVGVVLVVMATLRAGMLWALRRRGPGRSGPVLPRLARNELAVAASTIGIAPDELRRAVDDGHTISAVAADAGVSAQRVVDAVVRDASAKVDRAVAEGNVPPSRARAVRNRLPYWAERFVLSTPAMLAATAPRG
jgi:hypothetical protein